MPQTDHGDTGEPGGLSAPFAPFEMPHFIFMLTEYDRTILDALARAREVRDTGLRFIGVKDVGLAPSMLRTLTAATHEAGQRVVLELVSLDRDDEIFWAHAALDAEVDCLLGGAHADVVGQIVAGTATRYFPFAGRVSGRPTRLHGTVAEIVESARRLVELEGVHGIDLLAYRAPFDGAALARAVTRAVDAPVIAAGGIDREERLHRMIEARVWGFTMGTAVLDGTFLPETGSLAERVSRIVEMSAVVSRGHRPTAPAQD